MAQKSHPDFIPDDDNNQFTTKLSSDEENQFKEWVKLNKITDVDHPDSHYDYRGFWKENPKFLKSSPDQHFTDKYKQPGHETFSTESIYAKGRTDAGSWQGDKYIPPKANKPTDVKSDFIPDEEPDEFDKDEGQSTVSRLASGASKWLEEHPKVREIGERFLTGTSPEYEETLKKAGIPGVKGTLESEGSLLPEVTRQPETFAGGFSKSIYNDMIRPQFTPSGVAGWASPGPAIPGRSGRFGQVDIYDLGNVPSQKLLPPATRFHAEPSGIADIETTPIRRSKEVPYRPTVETPSGRIEQSFSTAAGDTPRATEAFNRFVNKSPRAAIDDASRLLPEGVRQPKIEDLMLSEEGTLPGEMSNADALLYEPEFKPWRGLSNLSERILGRDIMQRDIEAGKDPFRGPIDWGPIAEGHTDETPLTASRPTGERKPTAKFRAYQETGYEDMPDFALYDVEGGPSHGTTTDVEGLKKLGIETPETPANPKTSIEPSFSRSSEPSFARTESGGLKMGLKEGPVIQILKKFYEGNPSSIATKELLQNSIDEINTAHPKGTGKIDVNFDDRNRVITVSDNGRGMTREQIETIYTDIGDTGKKSSETVGGFGVAKAAIQLAGENVEVHTVARNPKTKKLEYTSYSTSPEDLVAGRTQHKTVEVPEDTPTGTKVIVKFNPDSSLYEAKDFVKNLGDFSTFKGEIAHNADYGTAKVTKGADKTGGKVLGTVSEPYADMTLSIPHGTPNVETQNIQMVLSNKGMFQGIMNYPLEHPMKVPQRVSVDVSSKVDALHDDYAFNPSRERLKWKANDAIGKLIQEHIVDKSMKHRIAEIQKLYDTMPEISIGGGLFPNTFGRKIAVHDSGNKFTPEEFKQITSSPIFHNIAGDIATTIDDVISTLKTQLPDAEWTNRLDKLGITFDDTLHGVHIPNPKTGKSMILINPFLAASRGATVEQAAGNTVHTILHEVAHMDPYLRGHNESFTVRLGEVYKNFGARKEVNALNKLESSFGTSTGEYHPELQEILQRYAESRGRKATGEDLLTGTGIGSRVGKQGRGKVPPGGKPNGEGVPPRQPVLDKLFTAIADAKEAAEEQATNLRKERAKRFAASAGIKAEGMEGAKKSLSKMRGEYEKSELPDALKLKREDVDSLFTTVKRANITQAEKLRGYTALFKLLNGEGAPVRSELAILDDVFGSGFSDKIIEMHGGIGAVGLKLAKAANTMKALQSSIDLSAPLKQGIGLIHRPEWREAVGEMVKYVGNKEYYEASMEALTRRPTYLLGREAGLFLAKPGSLVEGEEAFMNNYLPEISKVPILGPIAKGGVGASERAYTGMLNKLRADVFDSMIREAKAAGHEAFTIAEHVDEETGETKKLIVPSKTTENIAKFINNATGRGNLGRLEKYASDLNNFIWSPRLIASRLTTLNPMYYASLDKFTRWEAIKSLFSIASFGAITSSLAAVAGAKVLGNPFSTDMDWFSSKKPQVLSADFGKIRLPKDQVLDPWAGYQQPIVAASRFMAGRTDAGPQQRGITALNFAANKASPAASLAIDLAMAKKWTGSGNYTNRFGQPANMPKEVIKRFVPIFLQDLSDLAKSDSSFAEKVGLGAASAAGMGVQDYPERGAKKMRKMTLGF